MKISPEQVARIATLARLELDDATTERYAGELSDVLVYMDKLNELDTTAVTPMYSPVEPASVTRPDEVRQEFTRDDMLANAPEDDGTFFIVPKIV